jgi:phosphopantetheine--protein transferase-like protein
MIGIDITDISRFANFRKDEYCTRGKAFTVLEWEGAFATATPAQRLAGIFVAKEAVMKAHGGPLLGRFDRIEIRQTHDGKPDVFIDGALNNTQISISHDGGIAVAVAYRQ